MTKLIPLDGKTSLLSTYIRNLSSLLHQEMKTVLEKNFQHQWEEQRFFILKTIAECLCEDGDLETKINEIELGLNQKPAKKGRPKKQQNPWIHLL